MPLTGEHFVMYFIMLSVALYILHMWITNARIVGQPASCGGRGGEAAVCVR